MIVYTKLWIRLKEQGISQYSLIKHYGLSSSRIHALKHNANVRTALIDRLCEILHCRPSEIMEQVPDNEILQTIRHLKEEAAYANTPHKLRGHQP